jgi:hypothetical protein
MSFKINASGQRKIERSVARASRCKKQAGIVQRCRELRATLTGRNEAKGVV